MRDEVLRIARQLNGGRKVEDGTWFQRAIATLEEAFKTSDVRIAELTAERDALREALVKCAIPYEGLLMDKESRKWIAPPIWGDIESAAQDIRAILRTDGKILEG